MTYLFWHLKSAQAQDIEGCIRKDLSKYLGCMSYSWTNDKPI